MERIAETLVVTGSDQVERASSKRPKRGRHDDARLNFEVGDACALPFADAHFDHSLSMLALQFTPDISLAIREMRRVTRPGGTVATATWDTRGGFVAFRIILDAAAMLGPRGHATRARAYTRPLSRPGELAHAWREAGLINVVQDMRTIRMDFASFVDFWAPAEGSEGPVAEFVGSLDGAAKSKLRDAVRSAYLDGEADGPRSYAADRLGGEGQGVVVGFHCHCLGRLLAAARSAFVHLWNVAKDSQNVRSPGYTGSRHRRVKSTKMTINRLKQSRKVCFLSIGPTEPPYANMERYKPAASNRSSDPSAANQAREYIRSFKRFYPPTHRCSPNKTMTLMSATGRVSQTVEKLSSNVNKSLAADGAFTRNGT